MRRMSHAQMYARLLVSDASYNGRFFTGVLTTGIYCLPSCKARKPKPENVRFFPTCAAAREAGLRPCRKCHPDDFARGADPVLEDIEALVAEIRRSPGSFADVRSVVRRSGFGSTRLFELFRQHYHATPADFLLRARIDLTKQHLLEGSSALLDVASNAGFESVSGFHEHFRTLTGLTPAQFRALRHERRFQLQLPGDYPLAFLRRALGRDLHSLTEKLEGDTCTLAARLPSGPALLRLGLTDATVDVEILPPTTATTTDVHACVVGILGLEQDASGVARLVRRLGLTRLVAGREGMRISQTASVFDGVLWAIIGQQINFAFACQLKRRLIERTGERIAPGLYVPPTPSAIAALKPADLIPLQFSRQKADYLIGTARLIAEGELNLAALRTMSATRAERTLLAIRGLGPWSVNYLMMRSLGFADCVPLGDTGVTSGLRAILNLDERPDVDATRRLMTMFSPYRSLATAHLWQFNQPKPA